MTADFRTDVRGAGRRQRRAPRRAPHQQGGRAVGRRAAAVVVWVRYLSCLQRWSGHGRTGAHAAGAGSRSAARWLPRTDEPWGAPGWGRSRPLCQEKPTDGPVTVYGSALTSTSMAQSSQRKPVGRSNVVATTSSVLRRGRNARPRHRRSRRPPRARSRPLGDAREIRHSVPPRFVAPA
jgi:hypothetical protein